MTLSWLHFSDWHQGNEGFDRQRTREALIRDIAGRADIDPALEELDFVVFSGDAANTGSEAEFEIVADELVAPVLDATGVAPDRFFLVPGNHDVNRRAWGNVAVQPLLGLEHADDVAALLGELDRRSAALSSLRPYAAFAARYLGDLGDAASVAYGCVRTVQSDGRTVALLLLDSTWLSGLNHDSRGEVDDNGHLVLGEPQAHALIREADGADLTIAVMHHPVSWLREFDRVPVERQLTKACDLILHGHEHVPDVRVGSSLAGGPHRHPGRRELRPRAEELRAQLQLRPPRLQTGAAAAYIRSWDRDDHEYGG